MVKKSTERAYTTRSVDLRFILAVFCWFKRLKFEKNEAAQSIC